jgi:SRSO17 transposase
VDGRQAWLLGARLYLPEAWLTPAYRTRARIPATATVVPQWQLALTLLRQVRAARLTITAVVGDAESGCSKSPRVTPQARDCAVARGKAGRRSERS